ncbi:MAG TPA: ABC transporter ATP-binding protein [Gemmatimonadales bacterium]|nr:ABC transporter ATP-binding protein [Gemmatimonadales bacterium]
MALELKHLTKRVGAETHIHETNLVLAEKGFNILLGTTLSGKTTLMQLMAGIDKPTSGEIWFKGANVTGKPVQKRNVAMVYQQFINYPHFTVYDNIASPLRVAKVPKAEMRDRVAEVAALLQLTPLLKRMPSELSGGQQQRTAMARALVKDADLVLLDEPLANLDYKLREELRDELPKLFAGRDCTVVYATTEPGEALLMGGPIGLLHEGRVVQYGSTSEIYRKPDSLLAAQVFSDPPINTAAITKRGDKIVMAGGLEWHVGRRLAAVADGSYTIAIRPHHIQPHAINGQGVPIRGRVLVTEISGSESVIHFELAGQAWVSQSHGVHRFEVGEDAQLYADVGRAMFFDPSGNLVAG